MPDRQFLASGRSGPAVGVDSHFSPFFCKKSESVPLTVLWIPTFSRFFAKSQNRFLSPHYGFQLSLVFSQKVRIASSHRTVDSNFLSFFRKKSESLPLAALWIPTFSRFFAKSQNRLLSPHCGFRLSLVFSQKVRIASGVVGRYALRRRWSPRSPSPLHGLHRCDI